MNENIDPRRHQGLLPHGFQYREDPSQSGFDHRWRYEVGPRGKKIDPNFRNTIPYHSQA